MSTYYEYKEVKVMIAHKLMSMEGWKVYGYSPDQSDSMTDYYCPAHWGGVAEKNNYILCIDVYGAEEQQEIKQYNNNNNFAYDKSISDKIKKLEEVTLERGSCESEVMSAKKSIESLRNKMKVTGEDNQDYVITGYKPAHMANPPKCNWHIEKDGVIVAKGSGILKFADIHNYYDYSHCMEDVNVYKKDKTAYEEKYKNDLMRKGYCFTEEKAKEQAVSHMNTLEEDIKLINKFELFINKLDTTCGCLVGAGDIEQYETIKTTEYKKELKAVEKTDGSIKDGQCFFLKISFNYGRTKGYVYRIHETEINNKKYYHAYKLNGKLTKECHGNATQANKWSFIDDKFLKWIEKGCIAWCELEEVKTPYTVEKVVKKIVKAKVKQ